MERDEQGKQIHFAWLRAKWNRVADDLQRQEERELCGCRVNPSTGRMYVCSYCDRQFCSDID